MPAPPDLRPALDLAIAAATAAGDLLRAEYHRPGGPRGAGSHAEVDAEAEALVRARLLGATPWRFRGEETGEGGPDGGDVVWVVDPNDGTTRFLQGLRGSAVSIALVAEARPVLGVVYAFAAPDGGGPDLVAWARGCGPITRNGRPVAPPAWRPALDGGATVLLSSAADRHWPRNGARVHPARFRGVPSIAYRLALVAVGDADATVCLGGPCEWDFAAGQALVEAAGGVVLDQDGRTITYDRDGRARVSLCVGGAPPVARALAAADWNAIDAQPSDDVAARPSRREPDAGRLARAQGALLGQLAGDALGALVEFRSAASIAAAYPGGVRELVDGGTWDTLAGQPTDDSELALALARALVAERRFDAEAVLAAYAGWLASQPFDVGGTTRTALAAALAAPAGQRVDAARRVANHASQANGSLMRVSPLGLFAAGRPDEAAALARRDSALTHPHPACQEACAAFTAAIAAAVHEGLGPRDVHAVALRTARLAPRPEPSVVDALEQAATHGPPTDAPNAGWVLVALQNAFFQLLHAPALEEALVATVGLGGDTDTTAAIAGALLGAVHGQHAIPRRWRNAVLTCRAAAPLGARRPRPSIYWPVDALELAEALLVLS